MKKKIVYDLDGVLRDFYTIYRERFDLPPITDWNFNHKGKTVYDWVETDYSILIKALPTKYLDIVKNNINGSKIEIWTYQPEDWIPYTKKWIKKYLGNKVIIKYLRPEEKYRKLKDNPHILLVDDYPLHPSYDRVILIDSSYNQNTRANIRIKTPQQLKQLLEKYGQYSTRII